MILYVLRRLLQLVPVFLCASFLIFSIIHLLPGDPVQVMLGDERYDETQYQLLRQKMGLDRPLYAQYFSWLQRLAHGDLGQSLRTQRAVLDTVVERYPATIYLALASLILGTMIAIPAGTLAAVRQNTPWDYSAMSFALFGIAVPNFWFALLLILGFGLYLGWFPTLGYVDPSVNFGMFLWYLTLPAIVLGTDMASTVTRYVRAEMLEQLKLDYVRTARAKGVAAAIGRIQTHVEKFADRGDDRHRLAGRPVARRIDGGGNHIRLAGSWQVGARSGLRARLSAPPRRGSLSRLHLRRRQSVCRCFI